MTKRKILERAVNDLCNNICITQTDYLFLIEQASKHLKFQKRYNISNFKNIPHDNSGQVIMKNIIEMLDNRSLGRFETTSIINQFCKIRNDTTLLSTLNQVKNKNKLELKKKLEKKINIIKTELNINFTNIKDSSEYDQINDLLVTVCGSQNLNYIKTVVLFAMLIGEDIPKLLNKCGYCYIKDWYNTLPLQSCLAADYYKIDIEVLEYLISHGANINYSNFGNTVLHDTVLTKNNIKTLFEKGIKKNYINQINDDNYTPLDMFCDDNYHCINSKINCIFKKNGKKCLCRESIEFMIMNDFKPNKYNELIKNLNEKI